MGCMLRSDKMSKYNMYLQPETAFNVLDELGQLGCVQFIDMNPELQLFRRNHVMEVCRLSEMERKLNFLKTEMIRNNIEPLEQTKPSKARPLHEFEELEVTLEKWKDDVQEMNINEVALLKDYLELVEYHYLLMYIGPMLGDTEIKKETLFSTKPSAKSRKEKGGGRLMVVTGVVRRTRSFAFETMLWRISHGIIYFKQASEDKIVIDPQSRQEIRKIAFLVICQGEALAGRIQKICSGFQVNTFPIPDTLESRLTLQLQLQERITDLEQVMEKTKYIRCKCLREVSKNIRFLIGNVKMSKAIYHTMNMFRSVDQNLICECWIPDDDWDKVNAVLNKCSIDSQSNVPSVALKIPTDDEPPTYHRVNKFTRGFQNLINAYGASTYRELNPGLYTVVTFPFLFAVMFGDIGHGIILVLCGLWMWICEKQFLAQRTTNEIWNIFFGGRYVVLMMGLFSVFTGFCYNDIFSRGMYFNSRFWFDTRLQKKENFVEDFYFDLWVNETEKVPYPYGLDPLWKLSKNKIMFENSYKMKMSIIIGVIHMMFGIILSFFNHRYFKRYYSIFLQFIPEILFLSSIFFFLIIMFYLKWFWYMVESVDMKYNEVSAPQILLVFIDMVLFGGGTKEDAPRREVFSDLHHNMKRIFSAIAFACIPIMLLGTPLYLMRQNAVKRRKAEKALKELKNSGGATAASVAKLQAEIQNYQGGGAELLLRQAIHTIEFVLGTVSHTASYLRLWALSLAHSELSEMLWNMILSKLALRHHGIDGAVRLVPIFVIWAVLTLAILVVMEGLSAFLHCLRLHWVEFMSKFYSGAGWVFRPFSFESILEEEHTDTDARCRKFTPKGLRDNTWQRNESQ